MSNEPNALRIGMTKGGFGGVLTLGGATLALGPYAVGLDNIRESEGHVVGTGGASTPKGFIAQGGTNALGVSVTQITVV